MITVCSGFSPSGYVSYGNKFLETFDKFWSRDINLVVYTEEVVPVSRGECRSIWDCDGALDFFNRHSKDDRRTGRAAVPGWRGKDSIKGYSWRFDAVKFFKQCVIPYNVSKSLFDNDILVWLDADVVTFANVPLEFIGGLFEEDTDLIYLGRGAYHSEIGFWAVRVCHSSRSFVKELAEIYTTDRFLDLQEHHSAFVFDYVKDRTRGLLKRNLTPVKSPGSGTHVFVKSPLHLYMDHLKGPVRKKKGYSPEHPIKWWEK